MQHGGKVAAVAGDGFAAVFFQRNVFPVGPQEIDGGAGNQCAQYGIYHAGDEKSGHVKPHDGEAHHGLDSDEEDGIAVFVGTREEKQADKHHGDDEFVHQREGEHGQDGADEYAGQCAADAVEQPAFGGGIVRLADEYGGEQNPIAQT